MNQETLLKISDQLHQARVNAQPVAQFGNSIENFTRRDAYQIQARGIALREQQGEKVIALKMGLTSEAKRKQMNLDAPLYGVLTDKMQIKNEGQFSLTGSIHPKIEPEVAFFIGKTLSGKVTRQQVLESCSGVCAALEILDSRYEQFKYFSMEEVISDNSSSSHYILGEKVELTANLKLDDLKMEMSVDGKVVQAGNSKDISGDPVISVCQLCELLAEDGKELPAGFVVLAGAATPAVALSPGMEVSLMVENLPSLSVTIAE